VIISTLFAISIFTFSLSHLRDDEDDENSHDDPEDIAMQKLLFCPLFLIVSSVVLAGMVWKLLLQNKPSFVGSYKIGLLGGSTLLYASISFISFLYFCNFQQDEEDEENGNQRFLDEEDNQEEEWNEEDEIEYRQSILCIFCLVISIVYCIFAISLIWKYKSKSTNQKNKNTTLNKDVETSTRNKAYADVFTDAWKLISISSVLLLIVSLGVVSSSLIGEEAERAREEGDVFNLIWIVTFVLILSLIFLIAGRLLVFGKRDKDNFLTGIFHGGILFFAASFFMVSILYGQLFSFDERGQGEEIRGSLGISLVSAFLAFLHFILAFGMIKYQSHVLQEYSPSTEQYNENNASYVEMT